MDPGNFDWMDVQSVFADETEKLECLEHGPDCSGVVEYRPSLSGTGMAIERCDFHWEKRLEKEDEIQERYPYNAPSDFDPSYAGERWDDDY